MINNESANHPKNRRMVRRSTEPTQGWLQECYSVSLALQQSLAAVQRMRRLRLPFLSVTTTQFMRRG